MCEILCRNTILLEVHSSIKKISITMFHKSIHSICRITLKHKINCFINVCSLDIECTILQEIKPQHKLKNGAVSLHWGVFTVRATYYCHTGFILVGRKYRDCNYGTHFLDDPPVCRCEFYLGVH